MVVFFFFLMIPRPLRSTLFPYTTLFRSIIEQRGNGLRERIAGSWFNKEPGFAVYHLFGRPLDTGTNDRPCQDRKSTRLNSSHITISYAVFCLKKKIKTKNTSINSIAHI